MLTYNAFDIETTDWVDVQCPVYEEEVRSYEEIEEIDYKIGEQK